jgi:hypothetical protein
MKLRLDQEVTWERTESKPMSAQTGALKLKEERVCHCNR